MPATDILILNSAVLDIRNREFAFTDTFAQAGGLAVCGAEDMPKYSEAELARLIREGHATAGGAGNTAPLVARSGLRVAVGAYVGRGGHDGLDLQGYLYRDALAKSGVDVSAVLVHPTLPTATTFIHEVPAGDRGGIAYFPNANDAFEFAVFQREVERLKPRLVYYMYSGLSRRGDANGGRDLAAFMRWCGGQGCLTIADSHTLTGDPQKAIEAGTPVAGYRLLEPLLPELNIFFTSLDEAEMITNTLFPGKVCFKDRAKAIPEFLRVLAGRFAADDGRTRWLGVTVKSGAYILALNGRRELREPTFCESHFRSGSVIDLVGAGDSFRAGLVGRVAKDAEAFRAGTLDPVEAVQCGNLMAAVYITSPLEHRYRMIPTLDALGAAVKSGKVFGTAEELRAALHRD